MFQTCLLYTSNKYINDSYEQAGQRESADIQSHKDTGEDTYASFKPKAYDATKNEDQSSTFVARNERRAYDATANSTDSIDVYKRQRVC